MSIPTIVGGKLTYNFNRKPTPTKKQTMHACSTSSINKKNEVKILGDSHLKGTASKIDQFLNTKFEVSSWIKPGAKT
jgi:hypothetical protein